jgi:hypothetical protein
MDVEDYISSHTSSSSAPVSLISDLRVSYTERDRAGVTSVELSQAHTSDLNGSSEKGNSTKKIESKNLNTSGSNGDAKDNSNASGSNGKAKDNFNTFGERELEDFDLDFGDELELDMNFG